MVSLVGWKQFECNILPIITRVTEHNFNSVVRRVWVVMMKGTFVELSVYASTQNPQSKSMFLKGPTAKDFVGADPAIAAGLKIVHGIMATCGEQNCRDEIENYVSGNDKVIVSFLITP